VKITKKITDEYISYIKSIRCIIAGCSSMDTDPDHLQHRGMGGAGKGGTSTGTIIDFYTIPLCRIHHSERHNSGIKKFEQDHKVNLWKEACVLSNRYHLK
jgi:hypothetical protein